MRALVLDPSVDDCARFVDLLRRLGYETIGAASALEVREEVEQGNFELMVLDYTLPRGEGRRFCEEIRERFGDEPIVIFVSASTTADRRVAGIELGADDFMNKPCDGDELVARIEAHRRRRTLRPRLAD